MIGNILKILGFLRCHRMGLLECITGLRTHFYQKNGRSTDLRKTHLKSRIRLLSVKTGFYHKAVFFRLLYP